jgi:hypothetical protein
MLIPVRFQTTRAADAIRICVPFDKYDVIAADFPGRADMPGVWTLGALALVLDLDTGKVRDWPEGREERLHLKPVDSGVYELLDGEVVVATRQGYVPGCIPGAHGDYVIMTIDGTGAVFHEGGRRWTPSADKVHTSFFSDDT